MPVAAGWRFEGWAEVSEMQAADLARSFEDAGVAAIIYTDIDRDGLLQGANVEATAALARAISIPVIASGGVASLDDIAALKAVEDSGIEGVICGRALYDGRVDPAAALALSAVPAATTAVLGTESMLKARVIPCLDVKDGRVVKGVNFVGLRDAGDPVEQARVYDAAGADELCFWISRRAMNGGIPCSMWFPARRKPVSCP